MVRPDRAWAGDEVVGAIAEALRMRVAWRVADAWPLAAARFSATAVAAEASGYGVGASAGEACRRAVMECAERCAQFRRDALPVATVDTYTALGGDAVAPPACGLYCDAQYAARSFDCAPFAEQVALEWVEVSAIATSEHRLLPVEFIYPRARLARRPLVVETSSGTAAHVDREAAYLAAVCEVIERDSFMLFWYRQPPTPAIPPETIPDARLRDHLRAVQAMGYVVALCHLAYDVGIPCLLIIALKGDTCAYGLGCHPDWRTALERAVVELSAGLLWLRDAPPRALAYRSLDEVRGPDDHYALYNRGPLHPVLRHMLARVLHSGAPTGWPPILDPSAGQLHPLHDVLHALARHGYVAYGCDLTPPALADRGAHVVRAVVPGLIPIHFGYNRLRLGCRRLAAPGAPGRLSTWLPHFMA